MLLNSRIADLPNFQPELDRFELNAPSQYDFDLQSRVGAFLAGQHRPNLRNLRVAAKAGVVTICGNVPTFYEREIAVRIARRVAGVIKLIDEIIVGRLHIDPRRVTAWYPPAAPIESD